MGWMEGGKWDLLEILHSREEEEVSLLFCCSTERGVVLQGHGIGAVCYGCAQKLPLFLFPWEMGAFPLCPLVVQSQLAARCLPHSLVLLHGEKNWEEWVNLVG